jgi:3-methylcrotonyl-CoA carboxylase beta subunit
MPLIGRTIQKDAVFRRNEEAARRSLEAIRTEAAKITLGGGERAIARQHEKNKLTARERIGRLVDPGTQFLEIGLFAAYDMYAEFGGAPAAGTVLGIGTVHGRDVVIAANDATVKAGAWFPITGKKNLRAQEIAMENRLPIIYLVDSAGVYLPMQTKFFRIRSISVASFETMR